ncbi:hypothetical protein ACVET5_002875 [Listeria monocytogenes]
MEFKFIGQTESKYDYLLSVEDPYILSIANKLSTDKSINFSSLDGEITFDIEIDTTSMLVSKINMIKLATNTLVKDANLIIEKTSRNFIIDPINLGEKQIVFSEYYAFFKGDAYIILFQANEKNNLRVSKIGELGFIFQDNVWIGLVFYGMNQEIRDRYNIKHKLGYSLYELEDFFEFSDDYIRSKGEKTLQLSIKENGLQFTLIDNAVSLPQIVYKLELPTPKNISKENLSIILDYLKYKVEINEEFEYSFKL